MGQKVASLEIELAMATGGAVADLNRFGGVVDKVSAQAMRDLDKIDASMQNIGGLSQAEAAVVRFAEATAKSAVDTAREFARIERAGESLSSQLERQLGTFGKTTQEIRSMRVEAAALAAEQAGQAELAARLRTQEADLWGMEYAAARQAQLAEQGLAEDRSANAAKAVAAAEAEATAIREAAFAHQMFEARARAGTAAMKEAEAATERDAAAVRRLREMLDPAAASQLRLAEAIADARRVMVAAGFNAEEMARAEQLLAARGQELAESHSRMGIAGMEAMHVTRAFADSIAAGQSPVRALTMEMGRITEAMSFWAMQSGQTEGAVGKLAGFLGGPWGIALTLATVTIAPLVAKLFESEDASKAAEKAFDSFAKHQDDIANFFDKATGKLIEQNRVLVQNATLMRQATMDKNRQQIDDLSSKAFVAARNVAGDPTPVYTAGGMTRPRVDDAIQAAITASAGDVTRLDASLEALARRRPELRDMVHTVSDAAAQTVLLARENARLGGEVDQLTGKTHGQAVVTADLIRKQVELATAHTPLEIARAKYNLVVEQGAAAEKAGGDALEHYRTSLTAASEAIKTAEAAQKAASAAGRDHRHELAEGDKAARTALHSEMELARAYSTLQGAFDPAGKALDDYSEALASILMLQKSNMIQPEQAGVWAERAAERYRDALRKIEEANNAPLDIAANIKFEMPKFDLVQIDEGSIALAKQIELWDRLDKQVQDTAAHMRDAFGSVGGAIGDALGVMQIYGKEQAQIAAARKAAGNDQQQLDDVARRSADNQLNSAIGLSHALKGLFSEHSAGYKAMEAAEKALTIVQLARTAVAVAEGAAQMFASLGPAGFPAVAAMLGVMAAVGFSSGGGGVSKADFTQANTGTGTVLGDPSAKSDSIKNAINLLHDVDDATLTVSRDMLTSLRAIETNIGGLASLLVRTGNIDASAGIETGVHSTTLSGVVKATVPLIGGFLGGVIDKLFGSKTSIIGSGLYGGAQNIGDILSGGYDLQTYSDIEKKKKFLGLTTSTKYSTQYGQADQSIDDQFTLVLRSFYEAIGKAAPELGQATSDVEQRLNSFVFSIGKIDIQGKTGTEIQEQLEDILGAAADNMAKAAVPGLDRFQKVGEGYFETLVRVATTVEQVDATFEKLGRTTGSLGIDVDMAIAGMFDSVSDFTSLAGTYFSDYYSKAEQAAAQTAQFTRAFAGLGLALPDTLAGFRQLVEAQDLTTDAGRETYVTLLKLAPAFSDLKTSMEGAKSAADILSEQQDLQMKLLQLTGDTAAIRAAELAKIDPSNRALQQQIYAIQDAQDAAKAADSLRQAWKSVGDAIMDEVRRIRGLTAAPGGSFASLAGQFNGATEAAAHGDQDAAKSLPGLSQALLAAAAQAATSRQELDRIQAQTAASLEATYNAISALAGAPPDTSIDTAAAAAQAANGSTAANDDTASEIVGLRADMADMSTKLTSALATIAGNTGRTAKKLDDVTGQSGGDAIAIVAAAA